MIDLPTILYKRGGQWVGPLDRYGKNTTFSILGCDTMEQVDAALADGWHLNVWTACDQAGPWDDEVVEAEVVEVAPEPAPAPVADNAPPTRAEMLQQASLLGIKVDRRWNDETLLAKINEAMKPAAPAPAPAPADDDPI
jgi:hypothetical protein